jgi:two-component system chemotaxis response regulator CheB
MAEPARSAYGIAAIGTSWGGLDALTTLLGLLPATLPFPTVVVQHRGVEARDAMVAHLQDFTGLILSEADDKDPLEAGHVYFAPANYHLAVVRGAVSLSVDPPVNHARPSIDVLFDSVARAYGARSIGVVLTGASTDGAVGLRSIRDAGGLTLVQDPTSAAMALMPRSAAAMARPHHVLDLAGIAGILKTL